MAGSSWRTEPAAELRGLAKTFSPSASWRLFSRREICVGHVTSPRTSSTSGGLPARRSGNVVDGPQIGRDVLALRTVAARGAQHENAILVAQRGGQAIDLGFGGESEFSAFFQARKRRTRAAKSTTSSSAKALSSDSIATR